MHASEFKRRHQRIVVEARGNKRRENRAFAQLVKRARAAVVIANRRIIGYRMRDGSVACVKIRYRSEVDAALDLSRIRAASNHSHIPVRVYRCGFCFGWHLTSRPA